MSLEMIAVDESELEGTRGGRGHGEYDQFLADFIEANIRGTKVGFEGVKANSIKASLKSAIKRAVAAAGDEDHPAKNVEVRGKDENVYLVRNDLATA
jgi:hypothetical protein